MKYEEYLLIHRFFGVAGITRYTACDAQMRSHLSTEAEIHHLQLCIAHTIRTWMTQNRIRGPPSMSDHNISSFLIEVISVDLMTFDDKNSPILSFSVLDSRKAQPCTYS
ncbi:unnamed protein product [Gongylonema pulchrum]|uniref:Uncharacterized protein n=1 Tax=Gongylonema pulchrum TaxID=637853 RepID=A0A183DDD8_9BILA|nr:unnamed protein product [Gongylonema pulchrum]